MPRPIVVFDLETVAGDAALAMQPDESWLMKDVRDNFKPETVEKYRVDNAAKWPDEIGKRAALDWRLGRIVAAGTKWRGEDVQVCVNADERALVSWIWERLGDVRPALVGFNIRNFDMPWLWGRTGALGLQAGSGFDARKYGGGDVIDWSDILSNYGSFEMRGWSLSRYAEWFELGIEPHGTGADVAQWWAEGKHEEIAKHLTRDLEMTWGLHHRFAPSFLPRVA